jgi:Uma2 family endonuclease
MFATVRLPAPISDFDLYRIGEENPGWKVELVDGAIYMTPTGLQSGRQNARLTGFLLAWADAYDYTATDSSTGYKLPNGNVLYPDGALVRNARLETLTQAQLDAYCVLLPDVVVELASKSDSLTAARKKCERWHREGVQYVILLDPKNRAAESWGDPPANFPEPESVLREVAK